MWHVRVICGHHLANIRPVYFLAGLDSMTQKTTRNAQGPREAVLIQSFRDAEALIHQRGPRLNKQFVFRIPGVSEDELLDWERILNQASHECGCSLGARCGVIALGLAVFWGCIHISNPTFTKAVFIRYTVGSAIVGGLAGKLAALAMARIKIFRIAREMKRRMRILADDARVSEVVQSSQQNARAS